MQQDRDDAFRVPFFPFNPDTRVTPDLVQAQLIVGFYWCGSSSTSMARICWLENVIAMSCDLVCLAGDEGNGSLRILLSSLYAMEKLLGTSTQRPFRLSLNSEMEPKQADICACHGGGCKAHDRFHPHSVQFLLLTHWLRLAQLVERHELNRFEALQQSQVVALLQDRNQDTRWKVFDQMQSAPLDAMNEWAMRLRSDFLQPLTDHGTWGHCNTSSALWLELLSFFHMTQAVLFAPTLILKAQCAESAGFNHTALMGILDSVWHLTKGKTLSPAPVSGANTPFYLGTKMAYACIQWLDMTCAAQSKILRWDEWAQNRRAVIVPMSISMPDRQTDSVLDVPVIPRSRSVDLRVVPLEQSSGSFSAPSTPTLNASAFSPESVELQQTIKMEHPPLPPPPPPAPAPDPPLPAPQVAVQVARPKPTPLRLPDTTNLADKLELPFTARSIISGLDSAYPEPPSAMLDLEIFPSTFALAEEDPLGPAFPATAQASGFLLGQY